LGNFDTSSNLFVLIVLKVKMKYHHHLGNLEKRGLLKTRKETREKFFRLTEWGVNMAFIVKLLLLHEKFSEIFPLK
jgi:predicted transcriptional regulator